MDPLLIVAQAIAVALGSLSALLVAKTTKYKKEAEKQEAKVQEKEAIIKKVGNKADSIVPLLMSMFVVEQELDGYEKHCNRCNRDPEYCSPQSHEAEKKERVMKLMQKWHKDDGSDFDFGFLDSKYNELKFSVLQYKEMMANMVKEVSK